MSRPDHLDQVGDVWGRGDLCNLSAKSDPAKKSWGLQHLRAAKAAHLPCQVYEGKGKRKPSENDYVISVCVHTSKVPGPAAKVGRVPTVVQKVARRIPSLDPIRLVVTPGGDKSDKT
jgi:hypothetical protein